MKSELSVIIIGICKPNKSELEDSERLYNKGDQLICQSTSLQEEQVFLVLI